jgi:putative colanic acid biosynthesis acetyltransferase WcaF
MTAQLKFRSNQGSSFGPGHRMLRGLWGIVWLLAFRPTPRPFHAWRRFLLRLFGARVGRDAKVYQSARIWAPWNLTLADSAVIGPDVDCYCVAPITVGEQSTVSQYCYLCTATHDFEDPDFSLVPQPIILKDQVWLCADVFVGPGVTIEQGAVVGARSSVFTNLPAWKVCLGSPAKPHRDRIIRGAGAAGGE